MKTFVSRQQVNRLIAAEVTSFSVDMNETLRSVRRWKEGHEIQRSGKNAMETSLCESR